MAIDKRIARLLDANLNRAKEGMRVVEDTMRFVFGDSGEHKRMRALRHRLDKITVSVYKDLVVSRDTIRDSGRPLREKRKRTLRGLVIANFRRAQEALRVLEEYSKLLSDKNSFKEIRYRLYSVEKKVLVKHF